MKPDMMHTYFSVEELEKRWTMQTVSVSFSLDKGESLVLFGRSGVGKSTVLRMIAGLEQPDGGRVFLNGRDITALPPGERSVGMVFQDAALFPHLTVEDNIGYGPLSAGVGKRESRRIAAGWLERFSLEGFARRRPDTLSGGEKQRVALARTLAVNPSVVLFDEPLSALDAALRERLRRDLRNWQREQGYTAVYVTHDAADADILGDRVMEVTS